MDSSPFSTTDSTRLINAPPSINQDTPHLRKQYVCFCFSPCPHMQSVSMTNFIYIKTRYIWTWRENTFLFVRFKYINLHSNIVFCGIIRKSAKVVKGIVAAAQSEKGGGCAREGDTFYTYDAFSEVSLTGAYVIYSAGPQPCLVRVLNNKKDRINGLFTSETCRVSGCV